MFRYGNSERTGERLVKAFLILKALLRLSKVFSPNVTEHDTKTAMSPTELVLVWGQLQRLDIAYCLSRTLESDLDNETSKSTLLGKTNLGAQDNKLHRVSYLATSNPPLYKKRVLIRLIA